MAGSSMPTAYGMPAPMCATRKTEPARTPARTPATRAAAAPPGSSPFSPSRRPHLPRSVPGTPPAGDRPSGSTRTPLRPAPGRRDPCSQRRPDRQAPARRPRPRAPRRRRAARASPCRPSRTLSGSPPARVATTGRRCAMASSVTSELPSYSVGCTNSVAASYHACRSRVVSAAGERSSGPRRPAAAIAVLERPPERAVARPAPSATASVGAARASASAST